MLLVNITNQVFAHYNLFLEKHRQANNSTVNTKPSASSPLNTSSGPKNYSTFQNLMAQLQPNSTKTPKGYSQNKQLLISKKNEIIKTALKNSLNIKKSGTPMKSGIVIFPLNKVLIAPYRTYQAL